MLNKLETRPLRVMFLLTSMPIGGAETLLVNLVRRIDRGRIAPMIGCLKQKDILGEMLAKEIPVFDGLINYKFDVSVIGRLRNLFLDQQVDAVITIGAGDKMFWGRIAAQRAGVPVILSALHSTGWPDGVGRLNRMLTGITDGFIAVARQHADYQISEEKFPKQKVFLIPNGINTGRFVFDENSRVEWRNKLGISIEDPVVGIVAALRPEKNHDLFLESARKVSSVLPTAQFVIVGDGPERERLQTLATEKGIEHQVHFSGSTQDIPGVLSTMDVFALTSHNEASPVSIMEALSCRRPVVATDVGSINESVLEGKTGFLVPPGDAAQMADCWVDLLNDPDMRTTMGDQGRRHIVENSSIESMTDGYMTLIEDLFYQKRDQPVSVDNGFVCWDHSMPVDNSAK